MLFEKTLVGSVIDDRFEILAAAGEGGMGSIYKARHMEWDDRIVAIKMLHPTLLGDKESRARFEREGKILSSFVHPHVTSFHHFGIWKKQFPYIVMEYIEGQSLRDVLTADLRLPLDRTLKLCVQMCDALSFAHAQGVVHRDLKPNNVMVLNKPTKDFLKLVDFGLARLEPQPGKSRTKLTRTGALIGSMYYMSPEQCQGYDADNRSDIYALGCVFYEMMSGEPPMVADNPIALMQKHVNESPVALTDKLRQRFPRGLDDVLFKAMAKDPVLRYQTMDELKYDLQMLQWGKTRDIKASQGRRNSMTFFGLRLPRR
ncbi:MAG: serine/threonine protein kinase [Candidatus Obscuribacterales bacterium]|nr:serine/threonine protein kinase [Candidatus Obscuribacterales bacterium]